jgi:isopentenyl-diphosphate delta-isomerase
VAEVTAAALQSTAATSAPERDRKLEHIELAGDRRIQLDSRFFDDWAFEHEALPEIAMDDIDARVAFLGKTLRAPLLVSCMTGGTGSASTINRNLAAAAERAGIAVGVGSQRKALEASADEAREAVATFEVRSVAPTVPVIGNLGAVQLNYGMGVEDCRRAVEMIGADALALHLNPLQEAIQPEGQCDFRDLLPKIGAVVRDLGVPVIAKEIGCGIRASTARALAAGGVVWIDTAGLGGTSWARIEAARADDLDLGELFANWGVPTPESIRAVASIEGVRVIGSGGVRSGLDVAKAIALGAEVVGLAQPFLAPALESADAVYARIQRIIRELKIAMFCTGAASVEALRSIPLVKRPRR